MPGRNGHEATRRGPAEPGRGRGFARPTRSQHADHGRSARVGESGDLVLLVVVCATRSEAESQADQGARVWREVHTTQATGSGRDGGRWKRGRERPAGQCIARSATFRCPIVVGEEVVAWAWAGRGRQVSGSKDSRVSA